MDPTNLDWQRRHDHLKLFEERICIWDINFRVSYPGFLFIYAYASSAQSYE